MAVAADVAAGGNPGLDVRQETPLDSDIQGSFIMRILIAGALIALPHIAAADATEVMLSASPYQSAPLYNGSYYTIDLSLDACVLTKTTSSFDSAGTMEKQVAITMDLAQIDPARVEPLGADVNLWAIDGAHVTCADLVGESCVVAERPGESIPMPAEVGSDFLKGRAHAKLVVEVVEGCQ